MVLLTGLLRRTLIAMSLLFLIVGGTRADTQISATVQTDALSAELINIDSMAEKWGITPEDYVRYTDIMTGPLKHWNPNIDPILALGIYAESDAQQQRFAELYARQEYQLVTQTQAFERAYHEAFRRLFPNAQIVRAELMTPYHAHKNNFQPIASPLIENRLKTGDRILYFANPNSDDNHSDVQHLQNLLKSGSGISADIYVLGVNDENEVRRWAKQHAIDIHLLNSTLLTLNMDNGVYQKLRASSAEKTPFYLQRDGEIFAVSRTDLLAQ